MNIYIYIAAMAITTRLFPSQDRVMATVRAQMAAASDPALVSTEGNAMDVRQA